MNFHLSIFKYRYIVSLPIMILAISSMHCKRGKLDYVAGQARFLLVPYTHLGAGHHPDVRISQLPLTNDCARLGLVGHVKKIHITGQSKNFEGKLVDRIFATLEFDESCNLRESVHFSTRNNAEDYRCYYKWLHDKANIADCGERNSENQLLSRFRKEFIYDAQGRLIEKFERTGNNTFTGTVDLEAGTESISRLPANQLTNSYRFDYGNVNGKPRLLETRTMYNEGRVGSKSEVVYILEGQSIQVMDVDHTNRNLTARKLFYRIGPEGEVSGFENHPIFKGNHETRYLLDLRGNWFKSGTNRQSDGETLQELVAVLEREFEYY